MFGSSSSDVNHDPSELEHYSHLEKFAPLPGNEQHSMAFFYLNQHHALNQGPTSAPAIPYESSDYFSWDGVVNENGDDDTQQTVQDSQAHINQRTKHLPQHLHARRRYSSNRIRHRSNLSQSYVNESENQSDLESMFPHTDQLFEYQHKLSDHDIKRTMVAKVAATPKSQVQKKSGRNPGFRLELDSLRPAASQLDKVQHQYNHALSGPLSDTNVARMYDQMGIFEPDTDLRQVNGDVDKAQENITPLMFPPQSEDLGYFGDYSQINKSNGTHHTSIPGGYLNVSSKINDSSLAKSGNNGDLDSFINFQIDEYSPTVQFQKQYYQQQYGEEFENTKIEAHFTPISQSSFQVLKSQTESSQYENKEFYCQDQSYNFDSHGSSDIKRHFDQSLPINSAENSTKQRSEGPKEYFENSFQVDQKLDHHSLRGFPSEQHGAESNSETPSNYQVYSLEKQSEPPNSYSLNLKGKGETEHVVDTHGDGPNGDRSDNSLSGSDKKAAMGRKKRGVKGIVCATCDKFIVRDFSRHMRIHDETGRFQCVFPPGYCKHKSRKFNRPYDYKKHLLNFHFIFDDPTAKLAPNLTEKLQINGQCMACGSRFLANEWLEHHILTSDLNEKCHVLQQIGKLHREDSKPGEEAHTSDGTI